MNSKKLVLQIVVFATCVTPLASMASKATPAAQAAPAVAATPAIEGVNPMTGKSLSEEHLARALSRARLQTQLEQENLKLAQAKGEIALSSVRLDMEKSKLMGGGRAFDAGPIPAGRAPAAPTRSASPAIPPMSPGMPSNASPGPASWGGASPAPAPAARASGTIKIGGETMSVAANAPPAGHAQVQWVDSQPRQVARAGSPLAPSGGPPGAGMLGSPTLPGLTPGVMPPGFGQPQ